MSKANKGLRVLFFSPPYPHLGGEDLFGTSGREEWFPLGVFALANAIRLEYQSPVHIYYQPDHTLEKIEEIIRTYVPDIVGITCFTQSRFACFELAQIVKKVSPGIKVVLGGPHATFLDTQIMKHYPDVDMIMRGYAEGAFLEVINNIIHQSPMSSVRGLTWRDKKNRIYQNPQRLLEDDLNRDLVFDFKDFFIDGLPAWKSKDTMISALPVETARGCVYRCLFCSRMAQDERRVIQRSPKQALEYVHKLYRFFGPRQVFFCDTNFTINKKRVFEFCDILRKESPFLEWTTSTRVDLVDKEVLQAMRAAGCRRIYYGVDSFCRHLLPAIGRNFSPEIAVKNLNLTIESAIEADANLIIGFPGEDASTVAQTYSFRKQLRPEIKLHVRPLQIMPGGKLYYQAIKEGFDEAYWLKDNGPDFPIYTQSMPAKRIQGYCRIIKDPDYYKTNKTHALRMTPKKIQGQFNRQQKICLLDILYANDKRYCFSSSVFFERIKLFFKLNGYRLVESVPEADIVLFNTCGLTDAWAQTNLDFIKRYAKAQKTMIIFGCLGKISPEVQKSGCLLIGSTEIDKFSDYFENTISIKEIPSSQAFASARPLVIAQGCVNKCSYCNIKIAKGDVKSRALEEILHEVKLFIKDKSYEIFLIAEDCGSWGHENGLNIVDLIDNILKAHEKITIKIYNMYPSLFLKYYSSLKKHIAKKRITYLLLPLQSASFRILKLMNRAYNLSSMMDKVQEIKRLNPGIQLYTHFMVNFPTETASDFKKSLGLAKYFDYANFIEYGENAQTPACRIRPKCSLEELEAKKRIFEFAKKKGLVKGEFVLNDSSLKGGIREKI
ncbi:MAG: radical SAM protein [Candidatus Omnitrophica bacterium]|nr:radical SAM protein [Candidatus Omnitrophota bacterium]